MRQHRRHLDRVLQLAGKEWRDCGHAADPGPLLRRIHSEQAGHEVHRLDRGPRERAAEHLRLSGIERPEVGAIHIVRLGDDGVRPGVERRIGLGVVEPAAQRHQQRRALGSNPGDIALHFHQVVGMEGVGQLDRGSAPLGRKRERRGTVDGESGGAGSEGPVAKIDRVPAAGQGQREEPVALADELGVAGIALRQGAILVELRANQAGASGAHLPGVERCAHAYQLLGRKRVESRESRVADGRVTSHESRVASWRLDGGTLRGSCWHRRRAVSRGVPRGRALDQECRGECDHHDQHNRPGKASVHWASVHGFKGRDRARRDSTDGTGPAGAARASLPSARRSG